MKLTDLEQLHGLRHGDWSQDLGGTFSPIGYNPWDIVVEFHPVRNDPANGFNARILMYRNQLLKEILPVPTLAAAMLVLQQAERVRRVLIELDNLHSVLADMDGEGR